MKYTISFHFKLQYFSVDIFNSLFLFFFLLLIVYLNTDKQIKKKGERKPNKIIMIFIFNYLFKYEHLLKKKKKKII